MRFFPEADIRQTEKRLFNTLNPEAGLMYEEDTEDLVLYDKHSTLFLLNSTLPLDQWDIEELLYFIYTGDAPVSLLEEVTARHISMAQHLLSAADCYGLERLRLL